MGEALCNVGVEDIVAPAGIEPASSESESEILSIEIRSQILFWTGKDRQKTQVRNFENSDNKFFIHFFCASLPLF